MYDWDIVIIVLTMIITLGIVLGFVSWSCKSSKKRTYKSKTISLNNDSNTESTIKLSDRHITLSPNEILRMVLPKNSTISLQKNNHEYNYTLKNEKVRELIISDDCIDDDLEATSNTRLINESSHDVILAYEDKTKKMQSIYLPAQSIIKGPVIRKGQKWRVGEISFKVSEVPKRKIRWNGKQIT